MNALEIKLSIICPHCKRTIKRKIDNLDKTKPFFCLLIKEHDESHNCPPFVAFIDNNGMHRGSQKIDCVDDDKLTTNEIIIDINENIREMESKLRSYHLHVPDKTGKGFEHKVIDMTDKKFMESNYYDILIDYLKENVEKNIFGIIDCDTFLDYQGGRLIYGKYLGMLYTIFLRDQKFFLEKSLADVQAYANLTIEKLLDMYELIDFFF